MQSLTKILLLTFCAKASAIFWFFGSGSFDRCSSPFDINIGNNAECGVEGKTVIVHLGGDTDAGTRVACGILTQA